MMLFYLVCVSGKFELCELFLEYKVNIWMCIVEEKSFLYFVVLYGNEKIVKFLVKEGEFENYLKFK